MRQAGTSRTRNHDGVMGDLLRSARDIVAGTLLESAKDASREILRRTMRVTLLYGIATVLMGAGVILLLLAGFEALRLIPLPDAAALGIMGLVALGGGFAAARTAASKRRS